MNTQQTQQKKQAFSPIPCRKCGIYPTLSYVQQDGMRKRKCFCPKCGLALYLPPGSQPDIIERWNSVNDRSRISVRPGMRSKQALIKGEVEPVGSFGRLTSIFDDENYDPFFRY